MARNRLDVKQAAQILGITTDAVHKRAKRGSLESEKDEDGRVFVWLDTEDNGYTTASHDVHPLLVVRLESENEFLRQELERRAGELAEMRRIVAGLVQRVPELEAPRDARESPESVTEDAGNGDDSLGSQEPSQRRSWLYRFFVGP